MRQALSQKSGPTKLTVTAEEKTGIVITKGREYEGEI